MTHFRWQLEWLFDYFKESCGEAAGFLRKRLKVEMRKDQVASVVGFGKWVSQVTLVSEESTCPSRSRLRST